MLSMKLTRPHSYIRVFSYVIISLLAIPLLYSIFLSGYHYVFDQDELNHVQLAYLYLNGQRPYLDIYNSFYTPVFEWVISPLFAVFGISFSTVYLARYFMIILFAIRVITSFLVVHRIFGRRIALLFLPMFLMDPFVIFSSMQIRPDNLMMTVYTVGFLFFTNAVISPTPRRYFTAGALLAASLLVLPKILPSIVLIAVSLFLFAAYGKKLSGIYPAVLGFFLPVVLFCLYGIFTGSLTEIIRQSVLEAKAAYSVFPVSIPLGNFYIPDNFFVYGTMGKPLTWFFAWFLPYAATAGLLITVIDALKRRTLDARGLLRLILGSTLLLQWGSLFFLQVTFMQHYLPISWLYALFAAAAIDALLIALTPYKRGLAGTKITLAVLCVALVITSIRTNIGRAKVDSKDLIKFISAIWDKVPEGSYTFPNMLFRPSMYPVTYGYHLGNVPSVILNRLPPIVASLQKYDVRFLLVDDYLMSKLAPDVQVYIKANYTRVPGFNELMIKKE